MYTAFGQSNMSLLIKKMNDPRADFSEDLAQAIGQDQDHLENQWRLQLGQPGILLPNQVTPTPRALVQTSKTQTSATDSTTPVFITAGSLLILLPIIGIVAMLVYQRRKRQQELAEEAAQHYQPVAQAPLQETTMVAMLVLCNTSQQYQPWNIQYHHNRSITRRTRRHHS